MARDTGIFAHGAVIVPDFVTPAEEVRILLRIGEAPWLAELCRRVQHYGYHYSYRRTSRPVSVGPFPLGAGAMAERLRPQFGGALSVQDLGMHANHQDFGDVVVSLPLGVDWPMPFRPRATRPYAAGTLPGDEVARCCPAARSWCAQASCAGSECTASTARESAPRVSATFRTLAR